MVEMVGSGVCEDDGISEVGISHSEVPTLCGPKGVGSCGIGLRYDIILNIPLWVVSSLVTASDRIEEGNQRDFAGRLIMEVVLEFTRRSRKTQRSV